MTLASFKLRFADRHVRALPAALANGTPFAGPGVDLRGDDAGAVLDLSGALLGWLQARQPGVVVRSMSFDRDRRRVLVSIEGDGAKPAAIRIDPPASDELFDLAGPLERELQRRAWATLARRST